MGKEIYIPTKQGTAVIRTRHQKEVSNNGHYDADTVRKLWDNPLSKKTLFIPPEFQEFLYKMISDPSRPNVGLQVSERFYSGTWNTQRTEPSCTVWALINSMRVLQVNPDFHLLASLLNNANGINKDGRIGLYIDYAKDLFKLENSPIHIYKSPQRFRRNPLTKEPNNIYKQNALIIKSALDRNNIMILEVCDADYVNDSSIDRVDLHAICASGYRVNENRTFDAQIIDSRTGIFWTSLEHISDSVEDCVHLQRKNPQLVSPRPKNNHRQMRRI
ncbi:MAG: hypothetical protein Q8O88_03155 [bacterium]|nr:hypothetical protein [bacterium]